MQKRSKLFKKVTIGFCLLISSPAYSWSGHGILFFDVLNGVEKSDSKASEILESKVQIENLNDFLLDTQVELPIVLNQVESWSQKNEPAYRPIPAALMYKPEECRESLENCFRRAIRINQKVPLAFYVQDFDHQYENKSNLDISEYALAFTFYADPLIPTKIKKVMSGDFVSLKTVLSTHVDEPDFGMDINLYDDNLDQYGYGFGTQPIGLPNNPLITQALFHMSTYQETCFIKFLSPRIKESYPAYRAHLYFSLAKLAKQKGHLYWSARFAAWGFHYLQDLTQPYHSRLFPDYSESQMTLWFAENGLGFKTNFENAKQRIANRHTLAEGTLEHVMYHNLENKNRISNALQEYAGIKNALDCKDVSTFMRTVVSRNGALSAPSFSRDIVDALPAKYVNNPNFIVSDFTDYDDMYTSLSEEKKEQLVSVYLGRLLYFTLYSKQCLYDQNIS